MPTDDAEARDLFVATVAAQCSRLCQILDQVRDFFKHGWPAKARVGARATYLRPARRWNRG